MQKTFKVSHCQVLNKLLHTVICIECFLRKDSLNCVIIIFKVQKNEIPHCKVFIIVLNL